MVSPTPASGAAHRIPTLGGTVTRGETAEAFAAEAPQIGGAPLLGEQELSRGAQAAITRLVRRRYGRCTPPSPRDDRLPLRAILVHRIARIPPLGGEASVMKARPAGH